MIRPYPWKCRNCGQQAVKPVLVNYSTEMEHDGRLYQLAVPDLEVLECENCHNRTLPDPSYQRLIEELRTKAGLFTPEQIRQQRERLGLTLEEFAKFLDVPAATISRWERDRQIQQRAMNDFMDVFFHVPEARTFLSMRRGIQPNILEEMTGILAANLTGSISMKGVFFRQYLAIVIDQDSNSAGTRIEIIDSQFSGQSFGYSASNGHALTVANAEG